MALRGLLVDVGGTLVDDRTWIPADRYRAARLRRMADALGGTQPWFEAFVDHAFEGGAATPHEQRTAEAVAEFLVEQGLAPTEAEVEAICRANAVPLRDAVQLEAHALDSMRDARRMGLRMAICSNTLWRGDEDARQDLADLGFDGIFDAVVTSRSTGYEKPHAAIFERCLVELRVDPADAAIVGDRLDRDVAGARGVGMRASGSGRSGSPGPSSPGPMRRSTASRSSCRSWRIGRTPRSHRIEASIQARPTCCNASHGVGRAAYSGPNSEIRPPCTRPRRSRPRPRRRPRPPRRGHHRSRRRRCHRRRRRQPRRPGYRPAAAPR